MEVIKKKYICLFDNLFLGSIQKDVLRRKGADQSSQKKKHKPMEDDLSRVAANGLGQGRGAPTKEGKRSAASSSSSKLTTDW